MKTFAVLAIIVLVSVTALAPFSGGVVPDVEGHPAGACAYPAHIHAAGWDFCWQQDDVRAQGIELNRVYFQEDPVLWKIGFPFSITQYEGHRYGPFKDTLGRSSPLGNPGFGVGSMQINPLDCPRFLGTGVLMNDRRICVETREGPEPAVVIWGRYNIFNYRFLQGYTLDARGVVEPWVRFGGTLIDTPDGADAVNHFHHLYWRVDFDIGDDSEDRAEVFLRPDEEWGPFRKLSDLPSDCRKQVKDNVTGWCGLEAEGAFVRHAELFTKWRVMDETDTNLRGHPRSYEAHFAAHAPVDGNFTTFDALLLEYKGDSKEIGFEVPARPRLGDSYVYPYLALPETVQDPVVWFAVHAYHDTRDEDEPTLSYHEVSFSLSPRNFFEKNPGEDTYSGRPLPVTIPTNPIERP